MLEVKKEGILLEKTNIEFENEGVLNPGVYQQGDDIHLFYRAVSKGNHSTIGYCRLNGPITVVERWNKPLVVPEFDFESQGVEDPRVVKVDDTFYLSYTAYDGISARGAVASSTDLFHFTDKKLVVPGITYAEFIFLASETEGKINENYYKNHKFYYQKLDPEKKMLLWDKNVIFFPKKIGGKLAFFHRIRPGIQLVFIDSLADLTPDFWDNYFLNIQDHIVMDPVYPHESSYIGGGCPPIETANGWLFIYHGVHEKKKGRIYSACASLLDLNNPLKEIARLPYPLFSPEFDWECYGEVNNVVFPTGTSLFGDTLYIYYGAADERIACASVSISALLKELILNSRKNEKWNKQAIHS
jgi:beta-1,2-mannobiose phosphorylase / 1,2-beta-oligomannan phosphorylase